MNSAGLFLVATISCIIAVESASANDEMMCSTERNSAYNCLASSPDMTSSKISWCLACITHMMGEDLVDLDSCEKAQDSTFCDDVYWCVVANCEHSCITHVANAYDCILLDIKEEKGCDLCPFEFKNDFTAEIF